MNYSTSRQSLSSGLTFFNKFIFPIFWIGGFGIVTTALLFSEPNMAGGFMVALLLGCLVCYFFCFPLKSVETDEHYLYVSNYRKTIQVPHSEIESITEAPFINTHPVWIRFRTPTEFGTRIIFIPYYHLGSLLMMSHPVVAQLKELAGLRE